MIVVENPAFTEAYYDLDKRAIGNSIQVFFADGSSTERVEVQYPIGHRKRREEGFPLMEEKFKNSLSLFPAQQAQAILSLFEDRNALDGVLAKDFMEYFVLESGDI